MHSDPYSIRLVEVDSEKRKPAEYAVRLSSHICGIKPPSLRFFEECEPSRDAIWLEEPAFAYYQNGTISVRSNLEPGQMVRSVAHEVKHAAQSQLAMRTLQWPYSDRSCERDAELFVLEHFDGLKRTASEEQARQYLNALAAKWSLPTSEKPVTTRQELTPAECRKLGEQLLARATARLIQRNGIKKPTAPEYR